MSQEPRAGKGIEPEMLAAYIDKTLPPEQRAAVEARLAADPDSHAVLVESLKTIDALEAVESPTVPEASKAPVVPLVPKAKASPMRWVMAGGMLAAAAAIVLAVMQPAYLRRYLSSDVDPRFERLVSAVGEERYIEARLTGGFRHGAPKPVTRNQGSPASSNLSLLAAAGEIQQELARNPGPQANHAWGVAQLLLGQLDGAVQSLTAAAEGSNDPAVLSDLAAAYVTRATLTDQAGDWPQALTAASRSVDTGTRLTEALFNRALAAEALGLKANAERYWEEFLAAEPDADWRAEANEHLQRLRQQSSRTWPAEKAAVLDAAARADQQQLEEAARKYSQRIRETIEDELLRTWAREELAGQATSGSVLQVAGRLAEALGSRTGDDLLATTIRKIALLDPAGRLDAAAAMLAYGEGRDAYDRAAMQDSVAPFSRAKATFVRHGLPLAAWSDLYLATASYYRGDYPDALAVLDGALTEIGNEKWHAVMARVVWLQGLIAAQRAEYDRSLDYYFRSLVLYRHLGELENQAAIHSLLATAFLFIGDEESVWLHTALALKALPDDASYRRQHTILVGAANRAAEFNLPEAALSFADQAAAVNVKWNDPVARVEISNYRSRALLQLQRPAEAEQDVSLARQSLAQVTDAGLRQRAEAEVMQSEADVRAVSDPRAGIDASTRAIDYFTKVRSALRVPRLLVTRASARRRTGDVEGALADLRASAARFDAERSSLQRSERLRLAYSDSVWRAYRQLVEFEIQTGAPCERVLGAAERGRAATLASSVDDRADRTVIPDDRRSRAVLSYSFVADRLVIIALRDGRCELRLSDISESTARQEIDAIRTSLLNRTPVAETSKRLFRALLLPVWEVIQGVDQVEIIADGPLHHLPFAVLRNPEDRTLIELMAIRMVPSLGHPASVAGGARLAMISAGGLVRELNLPPLPGVKVELQQVQTAVSAANIPTLEANDSASFAKGLKRADIVHFAGHAVLNDRYPLLSRLVLAGADRDEWVTAERLGTLGPIAPRLVFLSACSTQSGRSFGGEGPASLARSFIAAGAREVVASLWPVVDGTTPELVAAFYRSWAQSADAAEALRTAVLAQIRERKSTPEQWAAWVVVGRTHARQGARVSQPTGD